MRWWIFARESDCIAANEAATDLLPDDTTVTGNIALVQITQRWAEPIALYDGRWALIAKAGMAVPTGAIAAASLP